MSVAAIDIDVYNQGMFALKSLIDYIRVSKNSLPGAVAWRASLSERRENVLLIVEDNPGDAVLLSELVKERFPHINIVMCDTVRQGFQELSRGIEWMIVDWFLPDGSPLSLLGAATETGTRVCVWSGATALSRLGISIFNKEEQDSVLNWLGKTKPSGICNSKH